MICDQDPADEKKYIKIEICDEWFGIKLIISMKNFELLF